MTKILICDDQDVVREGLNAILGTVPEMEVVGMARDGAEALELIPTSIPDLVLMDLKMPDMNGIQATRAIIKEHPDVKVLVLTTYDVDEWVYDAIRAGAHGYLLKDTPREGLIAAIMGTLAGQTHVDPNVAGKLINQVVRAGTLPATTLADELSDRELDVLRLLARGFSNAEIAERLYLSEGTVPNYVSAILAKLDVADRTQAAVLALRHGIVDMSGE